MPILKRYIHIMIEILLAKITSKFYLVSGEDTLFARMIGMKNKEDIFYIGNGINPELFKPINFEEKCKAKSDLGLRKENIVIGFVARLVEEKGILELFDAFKYFWIILSFFTISKSSLSSIPLKVFNISLFLPFI